MNAPAAMARAGTGTGQWHGLLALGAAAGAAGLALTSSGSMVVAAVLLGAAAGRRSSAAAALLAVAAVGARFSTVSFDDVAGIQSVLGAAGVIGPATAAASAWCAAAAVVIGARSRAGAGADERLLVAGAAGALAAAIVAGPGPGGALWVRVAATVAALGAALVLDAAVRRRPPLLPITAGLAVVAGIAALVLAGWPS